MSAEDHLTLSPWEKFKQHRRIPWKLILHVVLLVLCWYQTQMLYIRAVVPYFMNSHVCWRANFFGYVDEDGAWAEAGVVDGTRTIDITHTSDLKRLVGGLGYTYRTINDDSVDEYVPIVCDGAQPPNCRLATNETAGGGGVPGVAVSIRWNDPSALTLPVLPVPCGTAERGCDFSLGEGGASSSRCERPASCVGRFGEFTPAQWAQFYQRVGSMTLRWSLRDTDVTFLHDWRSCRNSNCSIDWLFTARFVFDSAGKLRVSYETQRALPPPLPAAGGGARNHDTTWNWRALWIGECGVGSVSLLLVGRAYYFNVVNSRAMLRLDSRRRRSRRSQSRVWLLLSAVQNVFNIASALHFMDPENVVRGDMDYWLATSMFLTIFNFTRYLEFLPASYLLVSTVGTGLPSVLRFIAGCAPVYLGFGMLGTTLFGSASSNFSTLRSTLVTLFSLLNGDSMLDVYTDIHRPGFGGLVADVYLTSFISLFIFCAIPVFISIMSDAYAHQKELLETDRREEDNLRATAQWQQQQRRRGGYADCGAVGAAGSVSGDRTLARVGGGSLARQSVNAVISGGLNAIGSIANALATHEDEAGTHQLGSAAAVAGSAAAGTGRGGGGGAVPADNEQADDDMAVPLVPMGESAPSAASPANDATVTMSGRHVAILRSTRAELMATLARMDSQLASAEVTEPASG